MKNFLFLSIFCILAKSCLNEFTCDPFTDCLNGEASDKVPDPDKCENYYICYASADGIIVPTSASKSCASGMYFDLSTADCANETNGACTNECEKIIKCNSECSDVVDAAYRIPNKTDCTYFTVCKTDNTSQYYRCPEDAPYFDGTECVKDYNECCFFSCTPYCPIDSILIEDPCDCTSFYICSDGEQPTENNKFQCDAGDYFDETAGYCKPGACTPTCTSCGTTKSPTTTVVTDPPATDPAFNWK